MSQNETTQISPDEGSLDSHGVPSITDWRTYDFSFPQYTLLEVKWMDSLLGDRRWEHPDDLKGEDDIIFRSVGYFLGDTVNAIKLVGSANMPVCGSVTQVCSMIQIPKCSILEVKRAYRTDSKVDVKVDVNAKYIPKRTVTDTKSHGIQPETYTRRQLAETIFSNVEFAKQIHSELHPGGCKLYSLSNCRCFLCRIDSYLSQQLCLLGFSAVREGKSSSVTLKDCIKSEGISELEDQEKLDNYADCNDND